MGVKRPNGMIAGIAAPRSRNTAVIMGVLFA